MGFLIFVISVLVNYTFKGIAMFYTWNVVIVSLTSFKPMTINQLITLLIFYFIFTFKFTFKFNAGKK